MDYCEHCKRVDETRDQIAKIYHVITGNGDPKEGLVYKVSRVEEHVSFMQEFGWKILAGAIGVPFAVLSGFIIFILTQ